MKKLLVRCFFIALFFLSMSSLAAKMSMPAESEDVVGELQFAQVQPGDTLSSIARRYDLGFFELTAANPEVDPEHLVVGTELLVPSQFMLPPVAWHGIVINLATMRLYYFPKNESYFYTYPVGIGKKGWRSPEGNWHIVQKIKNPVWRVPDSIFHYRMAHGDPVPHQIPSGPDNPLGYFAMRLSNPSYLIHGTNEPSSVGRRSSAGCIHLYPEDIKQLFSLVGTHTPVAIINQPYIIGWHNGQLMLSAHLPLVEERPLLADTKKDLAVLFDSVSTDPTEEQQANAVQILKDHTGLIQSLS